MTTPGKCFTLLRDKLERRLITEVGITPCRENLEKAIISEAKDQPAIKCKALWNTGATSSLISKRLANELNLKSFQMGPMSTASGKDIVPLYDLSFYLPNRLVVSTPRVFEGQLEAQGIDALIGMDIIGLGDFIVSNYNGKTCMTFRMPSMHAYDFTKESYLEK